VDAQEIVGPHHRFKFTRLEMRVVRSFAHRDRHGVFQVLDEQDFIEVNFYRSFVDIEKVMVCTSSRCGLMPMYSARISAARGSSSTTRQGRGKCGLLLMAVAFLRLLYWRQPHLGNVAKLKF